MSPRFYFIAILFTIASVTQSFAQEKEAEEKEEKQKPIYVQKMLKSKVLPISQPIAFQKSDTKEAKERTDVDILKTEITLPTDFDGVVETLGNEIKLNYTMQKNGYQFFSFNLSSSKYDKVSVKIKTPNLIEVFSGNQKLGTKSTKEEDMEKAKNFTTSFALMPNESKTLIVKVLRDKDLGQEEKMQIEVNGTDNSSLEVNLNSKRFTKVEDMMVGTRAVGVSTSPDGDYAILNYSNVDAKGKSSMYQELKNIKTNATQRIPNVGYRWLPKTNKLYYTSKNENEQNSLMFVDPATFIEEIITENLPNGDFYFSPSEDYLIFSESEDLDKRKGDLKLLLSPEDRQPGYLRKNNLFFYDLTTGIKQPINYGNASVYIESISDDGNKLILSRSDENITERPFRRKTVYLLDKTTQQLDTILKDEKFLSNSIFSPNAKKLLIFGGAEAFDKSAVANSSIEIPNNYDTQAFLYDIDTKAVQPLTKDFNPSLKSGYWLDNDNIYFSTVDKTQENVYHYNLKNKQFNKLNLEGDVITTVSPDKKKKTFNYISKSHKSPAVAYNYDLQSKKSKKLSAPMDKKMGDIELGEIFDYTYITPDSVVVDGFYHLPPNFDPSKKYPMIVYYYGGTTPDAKVFEHPYSRHYFASLGYVVYTIIPRGAIGYGTDFSATHVNDWGQIAANDIINATENFVKNHPYVDIENIGCVGASYGGFMTMYLQTQTNLFKAAIAHAGISALSSYWGEGYWGYSYSGVASAESYPWNNKKLYTEQSPLFLADKINTPLLLTHGTVDTNVPVGESIQMYTALKILGKPVELLEVKNENHGIANFDRKIKWTHSMGAWFDKWLKDQPKWWDSMYSLEEEK